MRSTLIHCRSGGTKCIFEQATVQAPQPSHLARSMTMTHFRPGVPTRAESSFPSARATLPATAPVAETASDPHEPPQHDEGDVRPGARDEDPVIVAPSTTRLWRIKSRRLALIGRISG